MKPAIPGGRPLPSEDRSAEGSIVRIGFEQGRDPVDPVQRRRDKDRFVVLPRQMSARA